VYNAELPVWLQLTRQSNTITAATSWDGINWTPISDNHGNAIGLPAPAGTLLYAGLMASAGFGGASNLAVFDNVSVTGTGSAFTLSTSPASVQVQLGQSVSTTVNILVTPGFADSLSLTITGMPTCVTPTFSNPAVIGTGTSTLSLSVTSDCGIGVFPITVTATDAATGRTASTIVNLIVLASSSAPSELPAGWSNQDVGQPAVVGQSFFDNGGFVLKGSGNRYSYDQFQYAFTALQGDGMIVARAVASQSATAQTGIMLRSSLDAASPYVELYVSNGIVYFVARTTYAGYNGELARASAQFPIWLELVRQGNNFSGYTSTDGVNWTLVGISSPASLPISMNSTIYAGLIDSSAVDGTLNAAEFDNVSVTGSGSGFVISTLPAKLITLPGATVGASVTTLATPGFADPLSLSISGLPDGATAALNPSSLQGSGTSAVAITVGAGVAVGSYPLTITAADSATSANQSVSVELIVLPAAPLTAGGLPAGWSSLDVGGPAYPGQSAFVNGVFQLLGSGTGADYASNDQFQYAFTALEGDGSIVARLLTNGSDEAGIMLRNSLDPGSANVDITFDGQGMYFNARPLLNAPVSAVATGPSPSPLPVWFKISRQGSNFSGFYSWDGTNWIQLGDPISLAMGPNLFAGLIASSLTNGPVVKVTFDNVSVTGSASGFTLASSVATLQGQPGQIVAATISSLGTPGFTDIVNLSIAGLPAGAEANFGSNALTGSASTALSVSIGAPVPAGFYPLTITASDETSGVIQTLSIGLVVLAPGLSQGAVPPGWANIDVDTSPNPGRSSYGGGIVELQGSDVGIQASNTADGFQYAYTGLDGDGSIAARVLANQNGTYQVGDMIRASLDNGSVFAALDLINGSIAFWSRSQSGAHAQLVASGSTNVGFPMWLKLVRQGNTFSPYTSTDGANWTQLSDGSGNPVSVTVPMTADVYMGLTDAAGALNSAPNIVLFDNVSVTSAGSGFRLSTSASVIETRVNTFATVVISSLATPDIGDAIHFTASGMPLGVSAVFAHAAINGSGSSLLTFSASSTAQAGSYTIVVTGTDAATNTSKSLTLTLLLLPGWDSPSGALPPDWTNQDIGQPLVAGETTYANGLFELVSQSTGVLVPLTADQFQFAYTAIDGDGTIVCRLLSVDDNQAQSGVMIRNSQDPSSPYVALYVYNGNVYVLSRTTYASQTYLAGSGPVNVQLPSWFKLARQGSQFLAFTSLDGSNWIQLTDGSGNPLTVTVQMNGLVYAGVFETSDATWPPSTALFDSVTATSSGSTFIVFGSPSTLLTQRAPRRLQTSRCWARPASEIPPHSRSAVYLRV
jgi:hypothetical protein